MPFPSQHERSTPHLKFTPRAEPRPRPAAGAKLEPKHRHRTPDKEPGLQARRIAAAVLGDVVQRRLALDDRLDTHLGSDEASELAAQDRGLVRAIATTAMRRLGTIRKALSERLKNGLPPGAPKLEPILISGVAQILFLGVPDHAAVDTAVRLAREDARCMHFTSLVNAVLRRIAREREAFLKSVNALRDDTPEWLARRWFETYGPESAVRIAASHADELAVDLTVKGNAVGWASRLGAILLPTGSLRLTNRDGIATLPGYSDGEWWVQDAAAAIPARLLRAEPGMRVLDLCAAPGGKTAQLALTGAEVVAVDRSVQRMARLEQNLARLKLKAETHVADALSFKAEPFDAILVDAPCSSTGTIRRHPDVAWTKTQEDILKLVQLQKRILDRAVSLLKPGGMLVYATCSLERDESEAQIEALLKREPRLLRQPIAASEVGGMTELLNADGDLRALPYQFADITSDDNARLSGCDGFYAARLKLT